VKIFPFNKKNDNENKYLDSLWTTPWQYRDVENMYVGNDNSIWLYRSLPLTPLQWEDDRTKMGICSELSNLLDEIGSLSVAPISGLKSLGYNREIHLVSELHRRDIRRLHYAKKSLSNWGKTKTLWKKESGKCFR
jgi:hypothetical protein